MMADSWIKPEAAITRLEQAGYAVDRRDDYIAYRKPGVSGKIALRPQGVDEWKVFHLEDRGS